MSEDNEYTVADIVGHKPVYKVEDGKVYQDGIRVMDWQLTPDELLQLLPERYVQLYGPPGCKCPICGEPIAKKARMNIVGHIRYKHKEWYELHRETLKTIEDTNDVFDYIEMSVEEVRDAKRT